MNKNVGTSISNKDILPFYNTRDFWFTVNELIDISFFNQYIVKNMVARKQYYVLLKVRYLSDNFAILDCQIPFKFDSYSDIDSFNKLRLIIVSRLNTMLDIYGLEDHEWSIIQVLWKEIEYRELEKLKVDVFSIKGKVLAKEYTHIKRLWRYLPMSSETFNYRILLKMTTNNKNIR